MPFGEHTALARQVRDEVVALKPIQRHSNRRRSPAAHRWSTSSTTTGNNRPFQSRSMSP